MTRISALDPTTTQGKTRDLLGAVDKTFGRVPNLFRVAAQSPAALEGMLGLFGALQHGALDGKTRESLALAVAERNRCGYCLAAHSAIGKHAGLTAQDVASARDGRAGDPRTAAALALATAIVDSRGHVADEDVAAARRVLAPGEVVEVVAHVALNVLTNYLNSVAGTTIDF